MFSRYKKQFFASKTPLATVLLVLLFVPASVSFAQTNPDNLSFPEKFPQIQEQLDVTVVPETPKPGDKVTISIQSYDLDLNAQLITWNLNGKDLTKGVGQKVFSFTLGKAGEAANINLTINTVGGSKIERAFRFSPVNVDLLWQANTYTPPFYKGKALYTPEANVTFVAIPNIISNGSRVSPSNTVYTWKQDYNTQGSLSGFGKNTYSFDGSILIRPTTIEATAYAANDQTLKGVSQVTVTPSDPFALVYEDSPVLGVLFNKSLGNQYQLSAPEIKIAVFPYFFSTTNKNSTVDYSWALNTSPVNLPSNQNNIILRRTDSKPGQSVVSVAITNNSKILQQAENSFYVNYGK